jgi:2-keto-4-pentenoate hydratase
VQLYHSPRGTDFRWLGLISVDPAAQQELVTQLAELRRNGYQQSGLEPALVPPDADTAYEIAAMVADELGWEVVGWKIAATNKKMQAALRTDAPIYGRVFSGHVKSAPITVAHAPLCNPIPEVEYQVRLGADLPPCAQPYTRAQVEAATAAISIGIELAECRFIHDDNFPALPAILADGAGSGTLILGPEIKDWRNQDITNQEVVLSVDGVECRRGRAENTVEHPIVPLTWLANRLSRSGIGMKAGQVISTGTLTGMLRPKPGETYRANFGPFGDVTMTLT